MQTKSVKKNAVLNVIKSIMSIIFPVITYPYATRILGVENLGKVNYSTSIVSYFTLLAALGITTYAIREGAKIRENKEEISNFSNEIFSINIITTIISYLLLGIFLLVSYKLRDYVLLILLQSTTIVFTTLGVDWLNSIYEDYLYITIRTVVVHIVSLFGLFIFVKKPEDYYIYAMLTVLTNAIICVSNFFYCRKYTKVKITKKLNFKKHIKYMLLFFANNVAVSIYVNADTTMLGWMVGDYSVGLYTVAGKVYSILKTVLASIYLVSLPRLTYYASVGEKENYKKLVTELTSVILLILLPCSAGLFVLAKEVILILSGKQYLEAVPVLQIQSIAIIFAIFGGILTQCMNVSLNKEKVTLKATIIGALTNIILNLFFIQLLQEKGAAITTVISELVVFLYCIFNFKDIFEYIDKKQILKNLITSFIEMILIIIFGILINRFTSIILLKIVLIMTFSIISYVAILIVSKNNILFSFIKNKGD